MNSATVPPPPPSTVAAAVAAAEAIKNKINLLKMAEENNQITGGERTTKRVNLCPKNVYSSC